MEKLNIYLAGQLAQSFQGRSGIKINLNYSRDKSTVDKKVSITGVTWSRENLDIIQQWITDGINGTGPGITEGIPFAMRLQKGTQPEYEFFSGYLDLLNNPKLSRSITADIEVRQKDSVDFINDTFDGKDFQYLFETLGAGSPGKISTTDFTTVPYILNSVPNYREAMMGLLSIYVLGEQINAAIQSLSELAVELSNPFEATAIVRAVLRVIYLGTLIVAIIKMIKDTVQLVIQPVKYHSTMGLLEQLRKGAEYFGYTFKCPILESAPWDKLYIMPQKLQVPTNTVDDRILGITSPGQQPQYGYYKGTIGDLFRAAKTLIRGKYEVLPNKEIWLVREDQNTNVPSYTIPNVRQDYYGHNGDELRSNYFIEFQVDAIDKNTIQQYTGTTFQVLCNQAITQNEDLKLLKGYEAVSIPFALAKRKEELTVPEKIIKGLLDVLDSIINALVDAVNAVIDAANAIIDVINGIINALDVIGIDLGFEIPSIPSLNPVNLSALIENRIGMLMIEQDNTMMPKLMLLDKNASNPKLTKVSSTNATTLTARRAWQEWHGPVVSMVPSAGRPNGNQAIKKQLTGVPFSQSDLQSVLYNNKCFDFTGTEVEIDDLEYAIDSQSVDMNIRISQKIGLNLVETFIESNGQ